MKPIERSAKPASTPKTGFFAMLRAFLSGEGAGGFSRRPRGVGFSRLCLPCQRLLVCSLLLFRWRSLRALRRSTSR